MFGRKLSNIFFMCLFLYYFEYNYITTIHYAMETIILLEFIKGIELFKGLDETELNILIKNIHEKKYKKDNFIFNQIEPKKNI